MTPAERAAIIAHDFIDTRPPSGHVHVAGYNCGHVHQATPHMVRDAMRDELVTSIAFAIESAILADRRRGSRAKRKARRSRPLAVLTSR